MSRPQPLVRTISNTGVAGRRGRRTLPRFSPFWRHYAEMAVVMMAGMFVSGALLVTISGVSSWDAATSEYPNRALFAMAAGMSVPMPAWMLFRRMGWRNSLEMVAAMALPVVPFACLVWFGVTESALCGPYCALTFVTMFALMRLRRDVYAMHTAH